LKKHQSIFIYLRQFLCIYGGGCFFHFSQAIYRHVQSAGFQASYAANPEFALMLRHLPALAFVPIQNVEDYLVIVHFNYFWNFRVFSG
jgi:hypothetical protein